MSPVGQRREEPPQERRERRVEGQEIVRVVVVEAAPVLRDHRDAHVGAREDDEGQAGGAGRRARAGDPAQGRERGGQVDPAERQGQRRARQALSQGLGHTGDDGPRRLAEVGQVGQHGPHPHRPTRRGQSRAVRHAVEPVWQAAEGERRQRGQEPGHEGPEPPAQEQDRHRRVVDEREEVGPEGQPERPPQQNEQQRGPAGPGGGRPQREEQGERPEDDRERIVVAGLVGPEQEEVRRERQQHRREHPGPRPEGVVSEANRQADTGEREQHRDQLERAGRDPEQLIDGRRQIAIQRAHERLAEEVGRELTLEHRQPQEARRRLVVPEARQAQQEEPQRARRPRARRGAPPDRAGPRGGPGAVPPVRHAHSPRGGVSGLGPSARRAPSAAGTRFNP